MSTLIPNPKSYRDGVIAGVAWSALVVVSVVTVWLLFLGWRG